VGLDLPLLTTIKMARLIIAKNAKYVLLAVLARGYLNGIKTGIV
jgi:hypothetical protein